MPEGEQTQNAPPLELKPVKKTVTENEEGTEKQGLLKQAFEWTKKKVKEIRNVDNPREALEDIAKLSDEKDEQLIPPPTPENNTSSPQPEGNNTKTRPDFFQKQETTPEIQNKFIQDEKGFLGKIAELTNTRAGKIARSLLLSTMFMSPLHSDNLAEKVPVNTEITDTTSPASQEEPVTGTPEYYIEIDRALNRGDINSVLNEYFLQHDKLPANGAQKILEHAIISNPFVFEKLYPKNIMLKAAEDAPNITPAQVEEDLVTAYKNTSEIMAEANQAIQIPGSPINNDMGQLTRENFDKTVEYMDKYYASSLAADSPSTAENPASAGEEYAKFNTEGRGRIIAIPQGDFKDIYFSEPFQQRLKNAPEELTYANAFSINQAVYRDIQSSGKPINAETINESITKILEAREQAQNQEIIGSKTKLILFLHEDSGPIPAFEKVFTDAGGKPENFIAAQGAQWDENGHNLNKKKILDAISTSSGETIVQFEGHGSPTTWAFTGNKPDDLIISNGPDERGISPQELGDALITSANPDIIISGDTCFGDDYLDKLEAYLETQGVKYKPKIMISSANQDRYAADLTQTIEPTKSAFFHAISSAKEPGTPITMSTVFKAESNLWKYSSPSIRLRIPSKDTTDKFLEIGAKDSDLYSNLV